MSFFEAPPPRPERKPRPRYRTPHGWHPPEAVLPGIVPVELIIGRTDDAAVAVRRISAYETGFELDLVTLTRVELDLDPFDLGYRRRRDNPLDPDLLRFGVEFADGRKATNVDVESPYDESSEGRLVLHHHGGGGGGGGDWETGYWVSDLPPEGPLAFVVEWPGVGLGLSRKEIDSQIVRDAAARSQVVWELPERPPGIYRDDD